MTHYLNLKARPFEAIREGRKTIELRLWDEKRQKIKTGDTLVFEEDGGEGRRISCRVLALHRFESFSELYATLPLDKCGYREEELAFATYRDMEQYYPPEKQEKYGVVGIELEMM